LRFSSGGGEHQSARKPTLLVKDGWIESLSEVDMDIRAGLLAVLIHKDSWRPDANELLVFDWQTAQNIAVSGIEIHSKSKLS
jgi:hypothetical protein